MLKTSKQKPYIIRAILYELNKKGLKISDWIRENNLNEKKVYCVLEGRIKLFKEMVKPIQVLLKLPTEVIWMGFGILPEKFKRFMMAQPLELFQTLKLKDHDELIQEIFSKTLTDVTHEEFLNLQSHRLTRETGRFDTTSNSF